MPHDDSSPSQVRDAFIIAYRATIYQRYSYAKLSAVFTLSEAITEDKMKQLRSYFLEWVYPPPEQRQQLDASFRVLQSYVNSPLKITGLLGNMAMAAFKFGVMLPSAIRAGIKTLQSYLSARDFEERMIQSVQEKNLGDIESISITELLSELPKQELIDFVEQSSEMFHLLTNTRLLETTLEVLDAVVDKMQRRPKIYAKEDVEAVQLGSAVLREGLNIFKGLEEKVIQEILELIKTNEIHFIEETINP